MKTKLSIFSKRHLYIALFSFIVFSPINSFSQDFTNLGGDLSVNLADRNAIQLTAPNVSDNDRRILQLLGFSHFHKIFSKSEGAGERLINPSCGGCHVQNGKGNIKIYDEDNGHGSMLIKVGQKKRDQFGNHTLIPGLRSQLQTSSESGKKYHSAKLKWKTVSGRYRDGRRYKLRRPILSFRANKKFSEKNSRFSLRMTPLLIGTGLINAIPDSQILAFADPTDANKDGISGKPNYVTDLETGELKIGKFGFKSTHSSLKDQTAAALFLDMGITNPVFNSNLSGFEFSSTSFNELIMYQALAGVPMARDQNNPQIERGKNLFLSIGCADCHKSNLITESATDPELNNQLIHPFSDFLLHDLGDGLADKFSEFSANGSEWRTTPLWGLGFASNLPDFKISYLHDGRARTISEAILWHGGEAKRSRDNFRSLSKIQRDELISFLRSL